MSYIFMLPCSSDSSRATVQAWHRRGRVSLAYLQPVVDAARKADIQCSPAELSPQAKHLEKLA